jgi:hypothetical protein
MTIRDSVETTSRDSVEITSRDAAEPGSSQDPIDKAPVTLPGGVTCLLEHVKIEPENTTHGNNSLIQTSDHDYSSPDPKEEESCSSAVNSLIQTSDHDYSSAVFKEEESCSAVTSSFIQSSSDHDYSSPVPKEEESCLTAVNSLMIQSSSSDHDYSWTLPKPESCSGVNNSLTGAEQVDSLNEEQTEKTRQTQYSEKGSIMSNKNGNVSRMSEPEKTFQVNH